MEENFTLWERITGATPIFFKKVQTFALALAGLGGTLATIHGVPESLTASLISAGTAVAAIAQFAVSQAATPLPPPTGAEVKTQIPSLSMEVKP